MARAAIAGSLVLVCSLLGAQAAEVAYVTADVLNERLCPSTNCPSTNKIYRGQKVDVFERRDGWARVSEYYDSAAERAEFPELTAEKVARWVSEEFLSLASPRTLPQPTIDPELMDDRIEGMPKVGEYGLTEPDVLLLRRYSLQLIKSGACSKIEYGDKSVNVPGRYYVVCAGEMRNRFFTEADVE